MCPKASIRQETEKSREKESTKARRFELSKIPSHALKPTATRQFEGSSERRIGEREREKRRQSGSETRRRLPSHSPQRRRAVKPAGSSYHIKCGMYIRPRMDPRVFDDFDGRNTENRRFFKDAAGKISVYRQIRRFSWIGRSAPISVSPTESWGSMSYHQILLKTCAIFLRPRVDLGPPPHFSYSDGQKYGKSKGFQGWLLEIGAFTRQVRWFSSICGSPRI